MDAGIVPPRGTSHRTIALAVVDPSIQTTGAALHMTSPAVELPAGLAEIRDDFLAMPESQRLTLLLEFANELPPLPARYDDHPDLLERVLECQSPVFLFVELDEEGLVRMHATAPPEAPTTRGFASILQQGIAGLTPEQLLAVPEDFPFDIGLTRAVSPLRLRGMVGMLGRAKRQVAERMLERERGLDEGSAGAASAADAG